MRGGAEPRTARRWLRRGLLVAIAALYVVSIPWYRTPGEAPAIWFGLPDWAAIAVACYAAAAVLNAAAWLLTEVEDPEPGSVSEDSP
jgi:uncharacterized membrane protein